MVLYLMQTFIIVKMLLKCIIKTLLNNGSFQEYNMHSAWHVSHSDNRSIDILLTYLQIEISAGGEAFLHTVVLELLSYKLWFYNLMKEFPKTLSVYGTFGVLAMLPSLVVPKELSILPSSTIKKSLTYLLP